MKPPTIAHKCVAYIRVSTAKQELSPKAQIEAIEGWCAITSHQLCAVFEDNLSGSTPADKRPGLLKAINALEEHNAGALIVLRRDRLARDVIIASVIERLVERKGARVLTTDGAGNGDTPEHQLLRTLIDAFAQYERALIRARTKAGMAEKGRRGELRGTIPYGFKVGPDGKTLVPDEEESAIALRIVRAQKIGMSVREIAVSLNAQEIPARGKKWHPTSVQRILKRTQDPDEE